MVNDNRHPSAPPASASSIDSMRNAVRMLARENPSARSVPISRVRAATMAFMVLTAPNTAPIPITTETNPARTRSAALTGPA